MTTRFTRRDRGVVLPLTALSLTVIILMVTFAVDLGRLRAERRDLQADADAIALDAVQKISGEARPAALAAAKAEADASALRNDFPAPLVDAVQVGFWSVEEQEFCEGRWELDDSTPAEWECLVATNEDRPSAVKIDLSSTIPMYFDLSADDRSVNRVAVAVAVAQTRGRLGSVLAGVNPPEPLPGCAIGASGSVQYTVANYVYTKLLGITVRVEATASGEREFDQNVDCEVFGPGNGIGFDAVSYEGLADADIDKDDLASEIGVGSPDELLDAEVTQKEVLAAAARVLQSDDTTATAGADLAAIAESTPPVEEEETVDEDATFGGKVRYGDMVGAADATTGSGTSAAGSSVNALDLLLLTATAIDGNNFVGADGTFNIPLLGFEGIETRIDIIESPQDDPRWKNQDEAGPRTSQVTVALDVPLTFDGDVVDLSHLSFLGVGANASVTGTGSIPIVVEVGHAESWYPRIACAPQGASGSIIEMLVDSGAARVSIGTIAEGEFDQEYTVVSPTEVLIEGDATVNLDLGLASVGLGLSLTSLTNLSDEPILEETFASGGVLNVDGEYELNAGGGTESHEFEFTGPDPTEYWRFAGGLRGARATDTLISSYDFGATYTGTFLGLLSSTQSKIVANEVVQGALQPHLDTIDTEVLQPMLNALGATAGGADGRINDVRCQVPALANRG